MDLDRCPRCGASWMGGNSCSQCRYVAIGAGLQNLPKKKKKKVKRYVEPGSGRGLLSFILLVGIGTFFWTQKPWTDDWEMVRSWFGQGKHHSLVGDWDVVQTMTLKHNSQTLMASRNVKSGTFTFSKKGSVQLKFGSGVNAPMSKGNYEQKGVLVAMQNLHSDGASMDLPTALRLKLAWTGPNRLIASYAGTEAIYLRRRDPGNPITRFFRMGIKPGEAQVPGQMRGIISTMQQNMKIGDDTN